MAIVKTHKVSTLPGTLEPDSIYYLRVGSHCEGYITDNAGNGRLLFSEAATAAQINAALAAQNAIDIVDDIAARDALFTGSVNKLCLVNDASGDATVNAGAALYSYRGSDGAVSKVTEFESLDITLTWGAIQGRPTAAVADIDDAVSKRHSHANKTVLDDTTIPAVLIAGRDDQNDVIPASNIGWVCRAQLLNADRERIGDERTITEVQSVNGVDHFVARLLPAESDQMTIQASGQPTMHYFSVEIENLSLSFRHTVEIDFYAIAKP